MLRQRFEELTNSFKRRVASSKEEEETIGRTEIDNNIVKILKLIKNDERDERNDLSNETPERALELVKLIQDFHKQYQLLYAHNIHLQEKLKKDHYDTLEDGPPSSAYSSDSEYFSSEEVENHNIQLENEYQEEGKILSRVNKHEFHENRASAQTKELEQRLEVVETELESLLRQKNDLEATCESKDIVAKQLREENIGLHAQISDLQRMFKQKENEMSSLLRKLEDNEKKLVSKLAKSMGEASNLQLEQDSWNAQKRKLEEMMVRKNNEAASQKKGLAEQLKNRSKKLESLVNEKSELESLLDRKIKEIEQNSIQIVTMKEELERKTVVVERTLEENARFTVLIKDLESEVNALRKWRYEIEQQIQSKIHEVSQLKKEKELLHYRVATMEKALTEEYQVSDLPGISKNNEHENSSEVMALTAQVQTLQHELENLQSQKSQLQLQIEKEKKEFHQCVTNMENQNTNLIRNMVDQERMLQNEQYSVDKLREENKQTVTRASRSKIKWSHQTAERKMEELAEEFRKKMEDNIRILCQRILVAEQLHMENKDSYMKMKNQIKRESRALEVKVANNEDEHRKLKDMSETASGMLNGLEQMVSKFEDSEIFMSRIARIAIEIQNAKGWVKKTNEEVKRLKNNADSLHEQLDKKEEKEFLLRQKVWNLEAKVRSMDEPEKLKKLRSLSQLEMRVEELEGMIKQKNGQLLDLGEEKREAIRQLCLLIDYHQGRYNHLRKAIVRNLNDNP